MTSITEQRADRVYGKANSHQISLDDLVILQAVADAGGFRPAAARVGLAASRVSDIVRRCEDQLGVRLFERNTRKVSPTDTMISLLHETRAPLADLRKIVADIAETDSIPKGRLRIGAPVAAGTLFLNDLAAAYLARNPAVTLDLRYDDAVADPIDQGLDLMIRSQTLLQQDHHILPIGPSLKLSLVAAPLYLEHRGTPASIEDIPKHDGICFRLRHADQLAPWTFNADPRSGEGTVVSMPRPLVSVDSQPDVIAMAKAGLGLAMIYTDAIRDELINGDLVEVLQGQPADLPGFSLAYLSKRHMSPKVRSFIDLSRELRGRK